MEEVSPNYKRCWGDNQKHSYIVCDLNKPETIKESFSKIDKLDVLINNAGVWLEGGYHKSYARKDNRDC